MALTLIKRMKTTKFALERLVQILILFYRLLLISVAQSHAYKSQHEAAWQQLSTLKANQQIKMQFKSRMALSLSHIRRLQLNPSANRWTQKGRR